MKTKLLLFHYILVFALAGCTNKFGITKVHAYSRKVTAGNLPVDNAGRPTVPGVKNDHLIFIEMKEGLPQWDTAWIEGRAYAVLHFKLEGERAKVRLGKTKDGDRDVTFQPDEGNSLWQLMLKALQKAQPSGDVYDKTKKNAVVLSGVWKKKRVVYGIKEETELATVFSE
jgi:hypothetical protein